MSYLDYNMTAAEMQEILNENISKIADRVALKQKIIKNLYGVLKDNQFDMMYDCGEFLAVGKNKRVVGGVFCRNRICPVCNRRYAAAKWARMYQIANQIAQEKEYCFLFFTVTVKNVIPTQLSDSINHLMKSIDRLHKRAIFKNNVLGYFRSLEITFNEKTKTFHPHYHYLLCVHKTYKENQTSTYEWRQAWEKSARLDYVSQIDIRYIDDKNIAASVAEVAKYAVKISSVIEQDTETIKTLLKAIKGRRLIAYGGIFKEYSKILESKYTPYDMSKGYELYKYDTNKYTREGAYYEDRTLYKTWQILR